jgi:small subunit ribosomal protein S18
MAFRTRSSETNPRRDRDNKKEGPRGGRFFRKKICRFCADRIDDVDFKDRDRLMKFLTEKGKIIPRRTTGNCAKHQRRLAHAIKRARHAAIVSFQID